jgi:hypothetical protein
MKKLLEIQEQYIEALKEHVAKSVELLNAAKYAMGNYMGSCKVTGCTAENRCNHCRSWTKVWDDIEAYIEDNE